MVLANAGGANDVASGVSALKTGADKLKEGLSGNGTAENPGIVNGASSVKDGATQVKEGLKSVQEGLNGDGTEEKPGLVNGAYSLANGLAVLNGEKGIEAVDKGAEDLENGAKTLDSGLATLNTGAKQLADGMKTFDASTGTLIEGIGMLDKGSNQLKKGMAKYYKEGIKKLIDMYNDDIKGLTENLDDVMKAGKDYDHFTKVSSGMDSKVHFVYKTEIAK